MKRWIWVVLLAMGCSFCNGVAKAASAVGEIGVSDGTPAETIVCPPPAPREIYPGEEWVWAASPEVLGWSSAKLAAARDYAESIGSAAVMIVDAGVVIDAWGDLTRNYNCHSMRKSLLSALYGIYVDEGTIDITQTLEQLGIDDLTPLTQIERQASVDDLLTARSGVYIPAAGEAQSMIDMRPERGSHASGTFWYYNNWDFNALGTIFDQETGEVSIYDAFRRRIAEPLEMQDFRAGLLRYSYVPYSAHPYYGFRMSTRDLARFGLLFLREGRWKNRRIIPSDWIQESTSAHAQIGPESGYGYMWWTGERSGLFPNVTIAGHGYYASGYRGHLVVVLPYLDLVIVHRVDTFEPAGDVPSETFGMLLWMILDAAGETDIGEPPFIDLAPGIRLAGNEVQAAISGSRLVAVGGALQTEVINDPDGTLSILFDGKIVYTGRWWVDGDRYCADVPDADDIGGCFDVMMDGNLLRLFELDGTLSIVFSVLNRTP